MPPSSDSRVRLLAPLGHGGMSDVWLGALRGPGGFSKLVAVKQLRFLGNEQFDGGAAFLREARLAAMLNHPNIVHTFEVLAQGGDYRIVMEFLEGQPLNRILRRSTANIPLRDYVRVVTDLLAGLEYAHNLHDFDGRPLSVVHLDVSPQNVFVTWEGVVKLLDFGIASFERSEAADDGLVKGKLSYMAPEQARGEAVDRRTDVFSAGALLFELLAGEPMWSGYTEAQVVTGLAGGVVPKIDERAPQTPELLRAVVRRATAGVASSRYPSAEAMRLALEEWLDAGGGRPNPRALGDRIAELFAPDRERIRLLVAQGQAADNGVEDTDLYAPTPSARRMPPDEGPALERPSMWVRLLVPLGGAVGALVLGGLGAMALLLATVFAAWWASPPAAEEAPVDPPTPGCPPSPRPVVELSGNVEEDATLGCARDYHLEGLVQVLSGVTLRLEAGTVVRGRKGAVLVVAPGGRLVAEGTATAPVVFTSAAVAPTAGDWGGIVILGRAPVNLEEPRFKGLHPDGDAFGGDRVDDDSGVLRYVRVEYAGTVLAPNNETNGLTLAGVGRGTAIDHVEVRHAGDDCFEWFGGTVDASHLVCVDPDDDGYDIQFGYTGTLSRLILVDRGDADPEHDGIEVDNDAARPDAEPRSAPTVRGATICGAGPGSGYGLVVRRGAAGSYRSLWVDRVAAVVDVRDRGGLGVQDVVVGPGVALGPTEDLGPADKSPRGDDDGGIDEAKLVSGWTAGPACPAPPAAAGSALPPEDRWDAGWVVWD